MKIFLKCVHCRHAIGQELARPGRHQRDEGQTWNSVSCSRFQHHLLPFTLGDLVRGELPRPYHYDCEEVYEFWKRMAFHHKMACHAENCPHDNPYPFRRFSLPFSNFPTKLGDPIPIPEEVRTLLRL